jgi:hypothetical protein
MLLGGGVEGGFGVIVGLGGVLMGLLGELGVVRWSPLPWATAAA